MSGIARTISWQPFLASALLTALGLAVAGCNDNDSIPATIAHLPYVDRGYKPDLPLCMRGTVFERTEIANITPYPVTGYSVVVNLQNTADNSGIPTSVRQALVKRMTLSGFGQHNDPRFTDLEPEQVLRDKRVAVVQVIGLLPVGGRRGQRFDVIVRAMPNSHTTSLAHGHMYNTELRDHGLEQPAGGGVVLAYADAGDVFVNPVYALEGTAHDYHNVTPGQVASSLRYGSVISSGRVTEDRPISLALRVPQASIARAIEARINTRIQQDEGDRRAGQAEDDGLVDLYLPLSYHGDWRHFVGVVNHLYLDSSPDTMARKVHLLMDEAHKVDAPLVDISFCLEGLGPSFVPYYQNMVNDPDPAVAFCAARAAACCGDAAGLDALSRLATDSTDPMQLAAVHAMGELPPSPVIDKRLESALGSNKDLVRIEAYKILADHGDRRIIVEETPCGFELDIVDYPGTPLIYASRTGATRIAVFGRTTQVTPPIIFSAMHDRFMISSDDTGSSLTIFYRDPGLRKPVKEISGLDLAEVIGRLGGKGPEAEEKLQFGYPDVVGLLQALSDNHVLTGRDGDGQMTVAPLVLDQGEPEGSVLAAASVDVRPQTDLLHSSGRPIGNATVSSVTPAQAASGGTGEVPSFNSPGGSPPADSASPGSSIPSFNRP